MISIQLVYNEKDSFAHLMMPSRVARNVRRTPICRTSSSSTLRRCCNCCDWMPNHDSLTGSLSLVADVLVQDGNIIDYHTQVQSCSEAEIRVHDRRSPQFPPAVTQRSIHARAKTAVGTDPGLDILLIHQRRSVNKTNGSINRDVHDGPRRPVS